MDDNQKKFQEIYAAFQPKILRYLTHLVGDSEAEDLTQDVFVKVNKALGDFRGKSKISTWLYRIATNAALDRMRSPAYKRTVQNCSADIEVEDSGVEIADQNAWTGQETPLVEQQVLRKEMNDCIQGFIDRLSENYRSVLVLSEFEGLRDSEIAYVLGVSSGTVKIRLYRARERLRQELGENCDSYWIEENEFIPELEIH